MRKLMRKMSNTKKKGYIVPQLVKYGNAVVLVKEKGNSMYETGGGKNNC